MNPRALALQLGQAVKETPEYLAVRAAKAKVEEHEAASIMLQDFQRRQEEYRKSLLEGKAGEEQTKELRELARIVGCNPYVRELFAAEERLAELVAGLQQEMLTAAGLLEKSEGGVEADAKDR